MINAHWSGTFCRPLFACCPNGQLLASHPALLLALGIPPVDRQELIHTPVLVPLEEEDLAVGPGQGGVRAGWHTGE